MSVAKKEVGGVGFQGICIEFGPIFLQLRFFNSKKIIEGT